MEKALQDNIKETGRRAEALPFHSLTYSLWGLFGLSIFSGLFLAIYYVPSFGQAFSSVERLNEEVPFGWMIRRLHGVGGNLLLLLFFTHLLRVFYGGIYKERPRYAWIIELFMLFSSLWVNFTGALLPLSQSAFWGTTMILSNLSSLPWAGGFVAEFLRGGKELGGTALVRFYGMHTGFSILIGLFLFFSYRMESIGDQRGSPPRINRNLVAAAVVAGLLLLGVTVGPAWFIDSLKEAANPTLNPERIPLPWYLLFLPETLSLFSASYPFGSLFLTVLGLLLLFLLPYLDRNPERNLLGRPFALALGAAFLMVGIYFSLVGIANARYGEEVVIPERALSATEVRGARVFAVKNCAYCHQVMGKAGRRQGPDMTGVTQRHRSRDWIQRFIHNARLYQPGTAMPRYEISLEDLEGLSAYLLSLDPRKVTLKAVERDRLLEMSLCLELQGEQKK